MTCYNNQFIWYPFVGLSLGAILTLAFLSQVVHRFTSIIQLHSTISSYCSDPRGFGNRFLLCLTFLVGYNHINLLIQEQMINNGSQWRQSYFYLQVVANFLLPLVGVFYTSSHGMINNVIYECGMIHFPIAYSEYIHSVSALGWMTITITLNMIYGLESGNILYLILCFISILVFVTFVSLQGMIEFYGVELQLTYDCPDCENETPLLTRLAPDLNLSNKTCRRCWRETGMTQHNLNSFREGCNPFQIDMNIQKTSSGILESSNVLKRSSHMFAWSFICESLTVLFASGLAYGGSVLRMQHGC